MRGETVLPAVERFPTGVFEVLKQPASNLGIDVHVDLLRGDPGIAGFFQHHFDQPIHVFRQPLIPG